MYGFMLSYLHTGDRRYIAASRRVSDYFLSHMPEDMLAPVDFCQSAEPHLIDNCANGIAACGLIELAKAIQDEAPEAAESYMNAARALLRALDEHCADWTEKTPAVAHALHQRVSRRSRSPYRPWTTATTSSSKAFASWPARPACSGSPWTSRNKSRL